MTRSVLVKVTWGPRPESLEQCVCRVKNCFLYLAELDDHLAEWFERRNNPASGRAIRWNSESDLKRLLEKGINYNDCPRVPIPELGYSLTAWNGHHRSNGAGINIYCGLFSKCVDNRVILKFSVSEVEFPQFGLIRGTLEALIAAWDPESGKIFQLIPDGEEINEFGCGGYSTSIVPQHNVSTCKFEKGFIWLDEVAYNQFV